MIKFTPPMVIIPILLLLGGILALAENTVPGDSLYTLKTKIAEPVAGVFSFTKEEKIEWQERIIERRLKEVEKLVRTNSLDEKNRLEIESSLKEKIEAFKINSKYLLDKKDSEKEVLDLNLRLEAALGAYQNVLSFLPSLNNDNKETNTVINTLISYKDDISKNRENLENNDAKNLENQIEFAQKTHVTAEELLTSTKLLYQENKVKFSLLIQEEIDTKLAQAEKKLEQGNAYVIAEDYKNATNTYNESANDSSEAKLLILKNSIKEEIKQHEEYDDMDDWEEGHDSEYDDDDFDEEFDD